MELWTLERLKLLCELHPIGPSRSGQAATDSRGDAAEPAKAASPSQPTTPRRQRPYPKVWKLAILIEGTISTSPVNKSTWPMTYFPSLNLSPSNMRLFVAAT